jgi:hypothetical protein
MADRGLLADPDQPETKWRRGIFGLTEDRKDHEGDQRGEPLGFLKISFLNFLATFERFRPSVRSDS